MASTSHAPTHHPSSSDGSTLPFWWARTASFLAFFPLGVWTVIHLYNNLYAFQGADAWERQVTQPASPITQLFTQVVVFLPLLIHTIWGVQRLFSARPNAYKTYGNLKYILQRVTAVGVLAFLGAHIWRAYLSPHFIEGHPEQFGDFAREMHDNLPTLVVYLLGTLGVAFHLANGISTFGWTWGWVSGRKAGARVDRFAIFVFLALTAMAWGAIYAIWHAGQTLALSVS